MVNHPNRKRKIAEDASFHEGEWVSVYNQKFSGEPIYEGSACIVGPGDVADQYRVRFDGAPRRETYLRFVYPGECQEDPAAWIKKCHAEWVGRNGRERLSADQLAEPLFREARPMTMQVADIVESPAS